MLSPQRFGPFSGVFHVVASGISRVEIIPHEQPYQPSAKVAAHIASRLDERSGGGRPLDCDGPAWKLWSFHFDQTTGVLTLTVGPGTYSQYLYTNVDRKFREGFPDRRLWFNCLAIGTLLLTRDEKICLGKRPPNAEQSPGRVDLPCGHPTEVTALPSNDSLIIAIESIIGKETGMRLPWRRPAQPLVQIHEEPHQGDNLIFLVRVAMDSQSILEQKPPEKELCFLPATADSITQFIRNETCVSPPVQPALAYFGRMHFGEEWFLRLCRRCD